MSDLDDLEITPSGTRDFDLRAPGPPPVDAEPPEGASEGRRPSIWVALAILVALVGAVAYFIYGRQPLPPAQDDAPRAAQATAPLPPPADPLPALDMSDGLVRQLVAQISSHPELATWLATNDLIRTFVAVVDKIAIGASPAKNAPFARPRQPFRVAGEGERVTLDPASYDRFNTLAAIIQSIDAAGAARAYARIKPLCEQAYRDLGYPDGNFDQKLSLALGRLLDTPVPEGNVELRATSVAYQFADPELEGLSSPQKQLLRMGPRNMQVVQAKLREIVKASGL